MFRSNHLKIFPVYNDANHIEWHTTWQIICGEKSWLCLLLLFWLSPCRDNLGWDCSPILHQNSYNWIVNQFQSLIIHTEELHFIFMKKNYLPSTLPKAQLGEMTVEDNIWRYVLNLGLFLLTSHFHLHYCQYHSLLLPGSFSCHKDKRTQSYLDRKWDSEWREFKVIIKSRHKVDFGYQEPKRPWHLFINNRLETKEEQSPGTGWSLQDGQPGVGGGEMEINKGGAITTEV